VVIGSGATAITLVPALAERAARVTMLQRSPTYVATVPAHNRLDARLRKVLGKQRGTAVARWKNIATAMGYYWAAQRFPSAVRSALLKDAERRLPAGFDLTHFSPAYGPWDQRLCASPEGDLFQAISGGRADVVTDGIETFTSTGIRLTSGRELDADIVITATGLEMQFFGGAQLVVDGREVSLPDTTVYKGLMLSGVPNLVFTFGYINSSWTLKADLVNEFTCRLLRYMDTHGFRSCMPTLPDTVQRGELFAMSSGYIQRAIAHLPGSGTGHPWRLGMNWFRDFATLRFGSLEDGHLVFGTPPAPRTAPTEPALVSAS
jgi:cation diffusion facilitator CzcD-associated flavoprotein CzcO